MRKFLRKTSSENEDTMLLSEPQLKLGNEWEEQIEDLRSATTLKLPSRQAMGSL